MSLYIAKSSVLREDILIIGWSDKIESELKKRLETQYPGIEILKFESGYDRKELRKIHRNLSEKDFKCKYICVGLSSYNFLFEGKVEDIKLNF